MKRRTSFLLICLMIAIGFGFSPPVSSSWTAEEIAAANTAKNAAYMDTTEQAIVMYCNLARLYPQKFNTVEVTHYTGTIEMPNQFENSENRRSLMRELIQMKAVAALQPDSALTAMASCFQLELAESGNTGHDRKKCTEDYMGENCSFGRFRAIDVVMQLLIDEGVASLGHRRNMLNGEYTKLGVAFGEHKKYLKCTVMDFQ